MVHLEISIHVRRLKLRSRDNVCAMYTVPALNWEYGMVLAIACLRPSAARKMQLAAPCVLSTPSKKTGARPAEPSEGQPAGGPFHEQKT